MYIERVKNRNSPPAILLRESNRVEGKIKKTTLANLSKLPEEKIDIISKAIKGQLVEKTFDPKSDFIFEKSFNHGHVDAVLTAIKKIGLDQIIDKRNSFEKNVILAIIASKIFSRKSKLSVVNECNAKTASSSLGLELGLEDITEKNVYEAMDWLYEKIDKIENKLIKKFLPENEAFIFFDSSSSYYFGNNCELADFGYSRDKKKGLKQINYGVITNKEGIPISFKMFKGNTSDTTSFKEMKLEIKEKVPDKNLVYVGDRGSIRSTTIENLSPEQGENWISAITNKSIIKLNGEGAIDMTLFDEQDILEITHDDYPGERLMVCRNPELAWKRSEDRNTLLQKTELIFNKYQESLSKRKKALGKENIAFQLAKKGAKFKMLKHFTIKYSENNFTYTRNEESIKKEEDVDGIYILRTSLKKEQATEPVVLESYKNLSKVEQLFRSFKSDLINIRPINHWKEERVRTHGFICMLVYIVEHHLTQCWQSLLFRDPKPEKLNGGINTQRSLDAKQKDASKENENGERVQSYSDIIKMLQGVAKAKFIFKGVEDFSMWKISENSNLQRIALELVKGICTQ